MDAVEIAGAEDGGSSEEEGPQQQQKKSGVLKDKGGFYYFGKASDIQKFLSVEAYAERWPDIPLEELHASSIQHPDFPEYRWLLHTHRVPVEQEVGAAVAREEGVAPEMEEVAAVARAEGPAVAREEVQEMRPRCAGIGDVDATVLLCEWCARNLCHRKPTLPKRALANDMWGGREHPAFQKLRCLPAARMLLGQARVLYRKVVLNKKHGRDAVEVQHGLQGNTTFIAQPKTSAIVKVLPPPMEDIGDQLQVIFSTCRQDVAKAKPLQVPRSLYLECARLRQERCPLFRDVEIDEVRAERELREQEAPPAFVAGAVHMEEANMFRPNLSGPASARAAEAAAGSRKDEMVEMGASDEEPEVLEVEGEEPAAVARGEAGQCEAEEAENLIGLDEAAENDPL